MPSKTPKNKLEAARRYRAKKRQDPEWCAKQSEYMKEYRKKNRAALIEKDRQRYQEKYRAEYQENAIEIQLERKGLDPAIHADDIANHCGLCDICGREPGGRWKKLNIDHCHSSGIFRGMLCGSCNRGLGYFKDDPGLLQKVIHYLVKQ